MYYKLLEKDFLEIEKLFGTPYYVYISLSNICNARCVFCNVHEEVLKNSQIQIGEIFPELKELGTKYVHFIGGGEPFANPEIWNYFTQLTELGIKIAVTTNGLALNEKAIARLKESNLTHMFISLDSHSPNIHNQLRGVDKMWQKVTENINLLKRQMPDVKIVINHLLNRSNIQDFEQMIQFRAAVQYDYLNPLLIKDCPDLNFTSEQVSWYMQNIDNFYKTAAAYGVEFLYDDINVFSSVEQASDHILEGKYYLGNQSCYFAEMSAYIDCPTGLVFPCDCTIHRNEEVYRCGDLTIFTFTQVWNGEKMTRLRNRLKTERLLCKQNCDLANLYTNQQIGERVDKV